MVFQYRTNKKIQNTFNHKNIYHKIYIYISFKTKDHFRLMHPMLEHSVTHDSTISQDLLKRI